MTRTLNAGAAGPDATSGPVATVIGAPPHVLAWITTAIALVGYVVLAALHITPPPVLDVILGGAFGSSSALSWPRAAG